MGFIGMKSNKFPKSHPKALKIDEALSHLGNDRIIDQNITNGRFICMT